MNCMIKAFAEALKCTESELVKEIGHDGCEIWWPELAHPVNMRGFNIMEFMWPCMHRGYAPVLLDYSPGIGTWDNFRKIWDKEKEERRLEYFMHNRKAVILGINKSGIPHAVYWDGRKSDELKDYHQVVVLVKRHLI